MPAGFETWAAFEAAQEAREAAETAGYKREEVAPGVA
jgi:hypothetical protein